MSADSTDSTARAPRRSKSKVILVSALLALATLVSWSQTWFTVNLVDGNSLEVAGQIAAPALSALALTSLVLVGALSIAGPFFRLVFGVLESLIGFAIVYSGILAVTDPLAASASAISTATGVAGENSVADLVESIAQTPWAWVAIVGGVLIFAAGIVIVVVGRSWPGSSRKYQATRLEPVKTQRTSVDDWDALSGGDDPTTRD